MVRLQKFLADAGIASRRAGEQIILAGRVEVNGAVVKELGTKVDPQQDRITLDHRPLKVKRKLYVALNKPPGFICSRSDPEQRPVVGDLLPKEWNNLYSVGRLDYDSEGLIFLTNDGQFCLALTHPRHGVRKKYLAVVKGKLDAHLIDKLARGLYHEGEKLKADRARLVSRSQSAGVVELELTEGKNREVRRMFEALGLEVRRLQRVQIGPIKLGQLPVGKWRTLTEPEIKSLLSKV